MGRLLRPGARKHGAVAMSLVAVVGTAVFTASPAAAGSLTAQSSAKISFRTWDLPGAGQTVLSGTNNHGDLAGTFSPSRTDFNIEHGFLVRSGHVVTIDYPGTSGVSFISAMNDAGTTTGGFTGGNGVGHGFVRDASGHFTRIDDPHAGKQAGQGTVPEGINDDGLVLGNYIDSHNVNHGFTWKDGTFTTLPNPPHTGGGAGQGEIAISKNLSGVLVGAYFTRSGASRGFVLTQGSFITFNAPGAGSGSGEGTTLVSIATDGTIAGFAIGADGVARGFVMRSWHFIPVVDPHAANVSGLGTLVTNMDSHADELVGIYYDRQGVTHGFVAHISWS